MHVWLLGPIAPEVNWMAGRLKPGYAVVGHNNNEEAVISGCVAIDTFSTFYFDHSLAII